MSSSIVKNAACMTAASIGQKIISLAYFILLARMIGPDNTGKYAFALSFTTIFVVFVDLGLVNVLVRESAKTAENVQRYLSTILSMKIVLGVMAYCAAIGMINIMGYPEVTKELVYVSGITMLFDSFHLSVYGVLRSLGNLRYEAMGIIGSQFLTLVLGSVFLFFHFPLLFLMVAFAVPSILNAMFAASVLIRRYRIYPIPRYDADTARLFAHIAVPFALAAVSARMYSYIDSILLSKISGDAALGWYSTAYKMAYAFQFIPAALIAAMYPRFSETFVRDRARLAYLFGASITYLLLVVVPIAVSVGVLSDHIIVFLYRQEYLNAILPLQILMASLVFSFLSFPIGALLNAGNRQATQTTIVAAVMIVNILLNLLLIPRFQAVGAAAAGLAGNIILVVSGYAVVPRLAPMAHAHLANIAIKIFFAGGIMGLVVHALSLAVHFMVAAGIGAVVYVFCIALFRVVTKRQVVEAIQLFRQQSS